MSDFKAWHRVHTGGVLGVVFGPPKTMQTYSAGLIPSNGTGMMAGGFRTLADAMAAADREAHQSGHVCSPACTDWTE